MQINIKQIWDNYCQFMWSNTPILRALQNYTYSLHLKLFVVRRRNNISDVTNLNDTELPDMSYCSFLFFF